MSVKSEIVSLLNKEPSLKARYIARILGYSKKEINHCLYVNKGIDFVVDESFQWSLIKSYRFEGKKEVLVNTTPSLDNIRIPSNYEEKEQSYNNPVISTPESYQEFVLDSYQSDFIKSSQSNIRLLAPAGSGKTVSLLYRCKYIYDKVTIQKPSFLIITYTKAAETSLKNNLTDPNFNDVRSNISIQTLNSWALAFVKKTIPDTKVSNFKDSDIIRGLRKLNSSFLNRYPAINDAISNSYLSPHKKLAELINMMKSLGFDHEEHIEYSKFESHFEFLLKTAKVRYLENVFKNLAHLKLLNNEVLTAISLYESFFKFWKEVTVELYRMKLLSFEDQKYWAFRSLKRHKGLQGKIDYIIVDEFQDINPLDAKLLKLMCDSYKSSLTVVGDDDQAIFEWRGSAPYYILNPDEVFERKFSLYILNINYRCPRNITYHASKLIRNNRVRQIKDIRSGANWDASILLKNGLSSRNRYRYVIELLDKIILKDQNVTLVARLKKHLLPYQVLLAGRGISFKIDDDLDFFNNQVFKDLESVVTHSSYPFERHTNIADIYLKFLNYVFKTPLKKSLQKAALDFINSKRVYCLRDANFEFRKFPDEIKDHDASYFCQKISELIDTVDLSDKFTYVKENFKGFKQDSEKSDESVFFSGAPMDELSNLSIILNQNVKDFFHTVHESAKKTSLSREEKEDNLVTLSTGQRIKGMQFDNVIILEVCDKVWPVNSDNLEQERRLFYVAITRTRRNLFIIEGDGERSRFVNEAGF
jgi:DNA helicase II / ATP-dependent DNA helicase PcrA